MKIVIIGGTGLIGARLVQHLQQGGHEVVAASPSLGVDTITGKGLAQALAGASVVVDVTNPPSFDDQAVMTFFDTSTKNLLAEMGRAGAGHLVTLSIVGTERLPSRGYYRAKRAQEILIEQASIPYTLVQATQFFEFLGAIADAATQGDVVRVSPALIQPIAADDVVLAVARMASEDPINRTIALAGPEVFRFEAIIKRLLIARGDRRQVIEDPNANYFGGILSERSLVPTGEVLLGSCRFDEWLSQSGVSPVAPSTSAGVRS